MFDVSCKESPRKHRDGRVLEQWFQYPFGNSLIKSGSNFHTAFHRHKILACEPTTNLFSLSIECYPAFVAEFQ
jgi:hypothetical protein